MKKILVTLTVALLGLSAHTYAQGYLSMNTGGGGVNAAATNRITGLRVSGTAFRAQLFWALGAGMPEASLMPVLDPTAFFNATGLILSTTGGGNRTFLATPGGSTLTVQIRAWEAALGADFATAHAAWLLSDGSKVLGGSKVINVTLTQAPASPALLTGLNPGWYLEPVPEPSIVALGILGGLGVLLFRRRK